MALGSTTYVRNVERSATDHIINAADSKTEFKLRRDRRNVRPYVRTTTVKLRWTRELHQSFMRAMNRLGGKATPKRILEAMNKDGVPDGVTIAHIKSHLQMYRTGKINAEGMPVHGHDLVQFEPISKAYSRGHLERITQKEELDASMALQLLRKGGFFGASENDGSGFLSGWKRKTQNEIELDLTMATRSPKIKFPSPSTPEEATLLSLGLSINI